MELFTYLMSKNDNNTSVKKDLFSYLLGKGQSGTYTDYSGTSLSINNTKKGKMKVNLLGNTSQDSTTGKNLFYVKASDFPTNAWIEYNANTQTYKIKQGTGIAPGYIPLDINLSVGDVISTSIVFTKGQYTGSGTLIKIGGYHSVEPRSWQGGIDIPIDTNLANQTYKNENFTITSEIDSLMIFIYSNPTISTELEFKIQIEKNTTSTSWEPYTNGASPNPDYPQDVNVVSGDNEVVVTGKNIFEVDNTLTVTSKGFDISSSDQNIVINGTYNGSAPASYASSLNGNFVTGNYATYINPSKTLTLKAGTYAISVNNVSGTYSDCNIKIYVLSKNSSTPHTLIKGTNFDTSTTFTLTEEKECFICVALESLVANTSKLNNLTFNIQLEQNSTATTYEKHQSSTYPIHLGTYELCKISTYQDKFIRNSGKNIVDNTNLTYDYSNTTANTLTTISSGIRYSTSLTSGTPFVLFKLLDLTNYVGKTIRMKANFSSGQIRIIRTNANTSTRDIVASSDTSGATISYVVPSDLGSTPYLAYALVLRATDLQSVDFTDLIITIDNSDMTYEPYGDGEWYLNKQIGRKVFEEGDFTRATTIDTATRTGFSTLIDGMNSYSSTNDLPLLLNRSFISVTQAATWVNGNMSRTTVNQQQVIFVLGANKTIDDIEDILVGYPLYYVLASPTYTKIEGTLKDELDDVWRANSYKEQTNINQVNNDLPFELNVSVKVGN